MSRKIKLKRKEIIRYGLPLELKNEKVCILGSYGDKNGNTFRPLTFAEEDLWMGELVGLKPADPNFRAAVTNWYKNLRIKVKPEGVELEIGEDEKGNPLNLEDWIKYKFALNHPWMAGSKKEAEGAEHLQFYFEDPEAENVLKGAELELVSKAYIEYAKLDSDEDKMDWILRGSIVKYPELGAISELTNLKSDKKKLKLAYIIEKDPQYFIDIVSDKDLLYKAEIASMVEAGVITKEGNKYINGTENLGSLESAIAWMKDGNNSAEYAILKARLEQFGSSIVAKPKVSKKDK